MAAKHCSEPKIIDKIYGICCVFGDEKLPTNADVLKQYLYNRKSGQYHDEKVKHFQDIASDIKLLWKKTKIAIVGDKTIERKLQRLYKRYRDTMKHISRPSFKHEAKKFRRASGSELFDIAICKCLENCKCSYEYKIRVDMRDFLYDQRNTRQLLIPVDNVASIPPIASSSTSECSSVVGISAPQPKKKRKTADQQIMEQMPIEHQPQQENLTLITTRKTQYRNVVREKERHSLSSAVVSSIINAYNKDIGVASRNNIVDRNVINRQTKKHNAISEREYMSKLFENVNESSFFGLFYDGKKDKTKVLVENEETHNNHLRQQTQDHYTIVLEPFKKYYAHVTPSGGKSEQIAECIWQKLQTDNINMGKLLFLGCDGANVNTGHNNGRNIFYFAL